MEIVKTILPLLSITSRSNETINGGIMEDKCEHEDLELMNYEYADDDVVELNFHCRQCGEKVIDSYQFIGRRENETHQL